MLALWIVIGLGVTLGGWIFLSTYRMLHPLPRFLVAGSVRPSPRTITLTSPDQQTFEAWVLDAKTPRGVLLTCHGYRANRLQVTDIAGGLCWRGYTVVVFDLRGHGTRHGPCTFGIRDLQDLGAILQWRKQQPELAGLPVGIVGLSMGASVACQAALQYPEIEAMVLDSAYARLFPILVKSIRRDYGLPMLFAWLTWVGTSVALGRSLAALDPGRLGPRITRPAFVIHGMEDQAVPVEHARELVSRWGGPTDEWLAPHIGHVGMFVDQPEAYAERTTHFFDRWLHGTPRPLPC